MEQQQIGIVDSETIAAKLHLILAFFSRNVQNTSRIALAYIARDLEKKTALANTGLSSDERKRSRDDPSSKYSIQFGAAQAEAGMRHWIHILQFGWFHHLHGSRAKSICGYGGGRWIDLLYRVPRMARMALALPLRVLLPAATAAIGQRMVSREAAALLEWYGYGV